MNNRQLNILIIDDESIIRNECKIFIEKSGYNFFEAGRPSEARGVLNRTQIDIVILDIKLPEIDGLTFLKEIKIKYPETEIIMITGHGDQESILSSMRSGAFDFFHKPLDLFQIKNSIERTKKYIEINDKLKKSESKYGLVLEQLKNNNDTVMIGENQNIQKITELIKQAAEYSDVPVLITGESGTGKELVAKEIHYLSKRNKNYFYPLNSSAIPNTLIESELFGHKKGSFTGALDDKVGCFEAADKGTLFLDEIGDMPINAQAKILRVLEDKKVSPIGYNYEIDIDVRIISATNKNIHEMISEKQFRLDLFHRINTIIINIPPLRERQSDIPLLFDYFFNKFSNAIGKKIIEYDKKIIDYLKSYKFPGNIRELKNLVERSVMLCDTEKLKLKHICISDILNNDEINIETEKTQKFDLNAIEKEIILKALTKTKYNRQNAAELLNISRYALMRKMKKHNI